jgi:hypothetical protein
MKGGRTPLAPLATLPETTGPMEMASIDVYLLHGRDMRMPNMDYLSARLEVHDGELGTQDHVTTHNNALADKLGEAYEVVTKLNNISREKLKAQYDKNTK